MGVVTVLTLVSVVVVVVVVGVVTVVVTVEVLGGKVVVDVVVTVEVAVVVVVDMVAKVNVAEAELLPASVAITMCGPGAPGGAVNVAEKVEGEVEELVTVAGDVVTGEPSYLIVIVELGANPDPVTETTVPGVPVVGLRLMLIETENEATEIMVEPDIISTKFDP